MSDTWSKLSGELRTEDYEFIPVHKICPRCSQELYKAFKKKCFNSLDKEKSTLFKYVCINPKCALVGMDS